MSKGIAKIENGISTLWHFIHDGNRCQRFFGDSPVPEPLPDGYVYADSHEDAYTATQLKQAEISDWFDSVINSGYDTGLGFHIKIDTEARNEFDALMTSINAELLSGTTIGGMAPQYIFGIDTDSPDGLDTGHVVSALQFIQLYAAGGTYYKQALGLRKQYTAAIQSGFTDFTVGQPLPGE